MLKLEIVTPEKRVLEMDVDSVTVPTATGEAGILPNHAPLVSALKPGILSYSVKGAVERLAIGGGFVEVTGRRVSVLADAAETAADIDLTTAKAEKDAAEKAFAAMASSSVDESEGARTELEAANVRVQLASGK